MASLDYALNQLSFLRKHEVTTPLANILATTLLTHLKFIFWVATALAKHQSRLFRPEFAQPD